MKKIILILGITLVFHQSAFAFTTTLGSLKDLADSSSDGTSSSTDDKMQARQLLADAELYYADPGAAIGNELSLQIVQLKKQHPEFSTEQAVDFIYERLQHN